MYFQLDMVSEKPAIPYYEDTAGIRRTYRQWDVQNAIREGDDPRPFTITFTSVARLVPLQYGGFSMAQRRRQ